jgi:hypothetical protein
MALVPALLALLVAAAGVPAEPVHTIQFARGKSSTSIDGAVARGERSLYAFSARAGQRLVVSATAEEQNVAFQVWRPGYRLPVDTGGDIAGRTLTGAGPEDDASDWDGRLPATGRYLLVVGATRGGATYRLHIAIK